MSGATDTEIVRFIRKHYGRTLGDAVARALEDDPDNETRAGQWIRSSIAREMDMAIVAELPP